MSNIPPTILRETFGAKLRRLAGDAISKNPDNFSTLLADTAWTTGEAIKAGAVRKNATTNKLYVAATTATAGVTMPSHTNGNAVTDGGVLWTYTGITATASTDSICPTVTAGTNALLSGLTFKVPVLNSPLNLYGGSWTFYATSGGDNYYQSNIFNNAAANKRAGCLKVSCIVDSEKFAILTLNGQSYINIVVDGRKYSNEGVYPNQSSPSVILVDFSANGGKKRRKIDIYFTRGQCTFGGLYCGANDAVYAVDDEVIKAVCISDSIWDGSSYGPFINGGCVGERLSKSMGWDNLHQYVIGGTGYIATNSGTRYTFGQRIAEALTLNPDMWIFMGSTNDNGQTSAAITAAALACYQSIRNAGNTAPIVVFGVWSLNNSNVSTTEQAVQAAVTQFADPLGKTYFIPIYADSYLPWVTGSWNNTANTGSTNAGLYISGDNTHPADVGSIYLSRRLENALKLNVLPLLK